jgi:plastocyanin
VNRRAGRHVSTDMPSTVRGNGRTFAVAALVALLLGSVAACGSDDDSAAGTSDGSTTSGAPAGDDYGGGGGEGESSTIVAQDFSLTDLTVSAGKEIVLRNDGDVTHTATADDGSFDLGEVAGGEASDPATAPEEPGSYPFHCEIHPAMTATLTVEG